MSLLFVGCEYQAPVEQLLEDLPRLRRVARQRIPPLVEALLEVSRNDREVNLTAASPPRSSSSSRRNARTC